MKYYKALTLSVLLTLSFSASAQVIKPALLKKVQKSEPAPKKESAPSALKLSGLDLSELKSKYASWGIDPSEVASNINLGDAWKNFVKKRDVVVAVIDTGIDVNHPFLKNNLYLPTGTVSSEMYGVDFSKGAKNKFAPVDTHGHGTHVSGIVKSVYPEVKILSLKYYNPQATGQDNLNSTIEALRFAVDQNVDVINYSGGGPEPALEELRILKLAEKKGILVVAAAGNEQSNIDFKNNAYYPASYGLENIISVTAHDQSVKVLSSSNYGKQSVDISAPGHRIKSALPASRAGFLTGTSQATAFVSGVAALLMAEFPVLTTSDIKRIIRDSAKKEIGLMNKTNTGGRLDASNAWLVASQLTNERKRLATRQVQRELAGDKKGAATKGL